VTLPADPLPAVADDSVEVLHCYRHPDRETLVRCVRCERPVCAKCQVRHPVGVRCPECGLRRNDPLTTLAPQGAALAAGTAVLGGMLGAALAASLGILFAVFVGLFGGGAIAEAAQRMAGYKYGRPMLVIVVGGIIVGGVLGQLLLSSGLLFGGDLAAALAVLPQLLLERSAPLLVFLVFAVGGAVGRLRI
jgi:hypothetical protein